MADLTKREIHGILCETIHSLYRKKNADYGGSFSKSFEEYGFVSPIIRMEDKLNRLKSLTIQNKCPQVADESIQDTLKDLAGYALLTLVDLIYNDQQLKNELEMAKQVISCKPTVTPRRATIKAKPDRENLETIEY